jgi:hypothetical protein
MYEYSPIANLIICPQMLRGILEMILSRRFVVEIFNASHKMVLRREIGKNLEVFGRGAAKAGLLCLTMLKRAEWRRESNCCDDKIG